MEILGFKIFSFFFSNFLIKSTIEVLETLKLKTCSNCANVQIKWDLRHFYLLRLWTNIKKISFLARILILLGFQKCLLFCLQMLFICSKSANLYHKCRNFEIVIFIKVKEYLTIFTYLIEDLFNQWAIRAF